MKWTERNAWVIGASSGIGAALATELSRRGCDVTVSARSEQGLRDVAQDDQHIRVADITDRSAIESIARELNAAGKLDIVIVAAGYWKQDEPLEFNLAEFTRHVEVNLIGLGNVIDAVLPFLKQRGHGQLAVLSSVAGYRGLPGSLGYGTTKAAQLHLFEALRGTFHGTELKFQTVSPGFVETPMTATNKFPMPFLISAEKAANYIADGLATNKPEIVFPLPMAVAMRIAKLIPQRLWIRIAGRRA